MRPTFEYNQLLIDEFVKNCGLYNNYDLIICKDKHYALIRTEMAVKSGVINMRPRMYKALTGCKKREIYLFLHLNNSSIVQVLTYGDLIPNIKNNILNSQYKTVCLNAGIIASDTAFDLPMLAICEKGKDKVMRWMIGILSRNPFTGGCILHEYEIKSEEIIDGWDL